MLRHIIILTSNLKNHPSNLIDPILSFGAPFNISALLNVIRCNERHAAVYSIESARWQSPFSCTSMLSLTNTITLQHKLELAGGKDGGKLIPAGINSEDIPLLARQSGISLVIRR